MKMKMTNETMAVAVDILSPLDEKGKLGYAIAYNLRKITDEAKEYLNMKAELIQKYGTKSDDGKYWFLDNDNKPEECQKYIEEIGDLPNIEHEVELVQISPEDFYSGSLSSSQMANLMWMVEDNKKPEKVEGEVV